ncbi:MAG TPA: hypothetical protein VI544_01215 [Candidatus Nanoarchaeia archaeon]|nr:hypothetical protein [Candidatus Nanoarchaeia archaeon]
MKYKKPIKTFLWGIAGFIVSLSIISKNEFSIFGYPLFFLSFLMFVLGILQAFKEKSKK